MCNIFYLFPYWYLFWGRPFRIRVWFWGWRWHCWHPIYYGFYLPWWPYYYWWQPWYWWRWGRVLYLNPFSRRQLSSAVDILESEDGALVDTYSEAEGLKIEMPSDALKSQEATVGYIEVTFNAVGDPPLGSRRRTQLMEVGGGENSFEMQLGAEGGSLKRRLDNTEEWNPDCEEREASCDKKSKPGQCFGDPHVKTWGGDYYDYQGECDLVFIHDPDFDDGNGLDIHIRTTIRYDYSFIETAAVRIGADVLEVGSWGEYFLNSVESADLKSHMANLNGFRILHTQTDKRQHTFEIVREGKSYITLKVFKDIVSVMVNEGAEIGLFKNSIGLLGTLGGQMLARDGKTLMTDPNDFGQEWQVRGEEAMLFQTARAPQLPSEQCRLPLEEEVAEKRRRLGHAKVTKEQAENACARFSGQTLFNCVFDVLAMEDLDMATAYAF